MDDEEYLVTNLDDGEQYNIDVVQEKFNVIRIDGESDYKSDSKYEEKNGDGDDKYYDAKANASAMSQSKGSPMYDQISVPEGARLIFYKIAAVGTTKDPDDKAYSVYYLDVRCNVASPSSWFVYRRYSQFRRLSEVLRSEGYYVPVLPPKKILGTFSTEFVRQRKVDLEIWLQNLAEMHINYPGSKDPQYHAFYRRFLTEDANKPPNPLTRIFPEQSDVSSKQIADDVTGSKKLPKVSLDDFELVKVIGKGSFGKVG